MERIAQILTDDVYLGRLLALLCEEEGFCPVLLGEGEARREDAAVTLTDADRRAGALRAGDIALYRDEPPRGVPSACCLALPFPHGALRAMLCEALPKKSPVRLTLEGRCAHLDGRPIALSETEAALLGALIDARGAYLSRDALLTCLRARSESALNVYVHRLRGKLEGRGERLLLCSRTRGYRLDAHRLGMQSEKE